MSAIIDLFNQGMIISVGWDIHQNPILDIKQTQITKSIVTLLSNEDKLEHINESSYIIQIVIDKTVLSNDEKERIHRFYQRH